VQQYSCVNDEFGLSASIIAVKISTTLSVMQNEI
jgi:hypothetical protein